MPGSKTIIFAVLVVLVAVVITPELKLSLTGLILPSFAGIKISLPEIKISFPDFPSLSDIYIPLINNEHVQLERKFRQEIEKILLDKNLTFSEQEKLERLQRNINLTIRRCDLDGYNIKTAKIMVEREIQSKFPLICEFYPQLLKLVQ